MLSSNTFAWFIYAQKVSGTVDVHVRSWKILFESNNEEITDYVEVKVDSIYPGMEDFSQQVSVYNKSDIKAHLKYSILYVRVLNDTFKTIEGKQEDGEPIYDTDITSEQLEQILSENYPFKITFLIGQTELDEKEGQSSFNIAAKWPYESGDDAADTLWGNKAYDFLNTYPDEPCIELKIKLHVTQKME